VRKVHVLYTALNLDFGISITELEKIIGDSVPQGRVASVRLKKLFDTNGSGVIDALEVLCGLTLLCSGSFNEKINNFFAIYDFNESKTMTYDELFILVFSIMRAMVRIIPPGKAAEPEDADVEKICDEIYLLASKEPTSVIAASDFVKYCEVEYAELFENSSKSASITAFCVKLDMLDVDIAKSIMKEERDKEKALAAQAKR
jgi:Ca2+-binding EF-hand superfamily protein